MTDIRAHRLDQDARDVLVAAFGSPPASEQAWRRWRRWLDNEDHMDPVAFALLARIFRNQSPQSLAGRDRARIKGVMRQTWVHNQRRLMALGGFFDGLESAGIVPLLLPPASLWIRDHWLGLGPLSPIEVALRSPAEAAAAIRAGRAAGWQPGGIRLPAWAVDGFVLAARQIHLRGPQHLVIRLEWPGTDARRRLADRAGKERSGDACALKGAHFLKPIDALALLLSRPPPAHALLAMSTWLLVAVDLDWAEVSGLSARSGRRCAASGWLPLLGEMDALLAADYRTLAELGSDELAAPTNARSGAARRVQRIRYHWERLRTGLGRQSGPGRIIRGLPGYLIGQWQLRSPTAVIPGIWSALRRPSGRPLNEGHGDER